MSATTATRTGTNYVPRAPQRRGEVKSRTPLHLRERAAWVRCWIVDHPRTVAAVAGGTVAVTLEHYQTSFPWVVAHAEAAGHTIAAFARVIGL